MTGNGSMAKEGAAQDSVSEQSLSSDPTMYREGSSFPPAGHDPLVGQLIAGRYRVDEIIGQGGMGRVYKAVHVLMQKSVALKVLRPEMTAVRGVLARFEREAVAAGRISHTNVVAATDFGRMDDGAFYLVLEYVDGPSLRKQLKKGAFPVLRALHVSQQICEALVAAHQQGVIHRDLKPDNILLVEDNGRDLVKVLDFGIAKVTDASEEHQTRYGVVMGTPRYMSPEQATGSAVDHRTDLYALGVILYEMLSGRAPFVATEMNAVLSQQLLADPPALPTFVSADLGRLCYSLLAKEAAQRPASAAEVLTTLREIAEKEADAAETSGALKHAAHALRRGLFRTGRSVSGFLGSAHLRSLRAWNRLVQRLPALRVLHRNVALGPVQVFLPFLLLGGLTVCALIVLAAALAPKEAPPAEGVVAVAEEPVSPAREPENTPPERVSREDLDDLLAIPVYKRDKRQWLTIAAAHADFKEWKQSVAAYRNALQLDPSLKDDRVLLQQLRNLAVVHEVYEAVFNVALNLLGAAGLDLMYDVWQSTRNDDTRAAIALNAQKNLGIFRLRSASPSLRIVLALQFAKPDECQEISKALTDALKYADERAVSELEKLKNTTGCGASKKRDCYPCIRERAGELDTAIKLAKGRKAPRFDGERYVPGWGG